MGAEPVTDPNTLEKGRVWELGLEVELKVLRLATMCIVCSRLQPGDGSQQTEYRIK